MTEDETASLAERGAPDGFARIEFASAFMQHSGQLYERRSDNQLTLGCRIQLVQCNSQHLAHGGFLLAFADFSMSFATRGRTLTFSADFMRPAPLGVWIEAHVSIRKRSAHLLFADTIVCGEGRELVRASGMFAPA